MRVLMISTDRNILNPDSGVAMRMVKYGSIFDELHVIIFTKKTSENSLIKLSKNVFVYQTNSNSRLDYIFDAIKIGNGILSNIYFGETVISTQDPFETAIAGLRLKNKYRFPAQIQIHTDLFSPEFRNSSIVNWIRFQISNWTLKRADGVRVVSHKIKNDLVRFLGIKETKIAVLPIFVDINIPKKSDSYNFLKTKYSRFKFIVLMASRLSPEKNIFLAIKAFEKLLSKVGDVGLVIVGEGEKGGELKNFVRKLNIQKNVIFEPWSDDLVPYYKSADLFLNTSNFEGYGMTLIEAGANMCPILTTNVGVAQDFFVDGANAYVCPVKDENCVAEKLASFFEKPDLGKNFTENMHRDLGRTLLSEQEYLTRYKTALELVFSK